MVQDELIYRKPMQKKCPSCKKTFETYIPHKIFCSNNCYKEFISEKRYKKLFKKKKNQKCSFCQKSFETYKMSQIYCSRECRNNAYKNKYEKEKNTKEYAEKYKKVHYLKLRFEILKRDNFTCQYCGRSPNNIDKVELRIDHINPKKNGGKLKKENLITACFECNAGKKDILLSAQNLEKIQKSLL